MSVAGVVGADVERITVDAGAVEGRLGQAPRSEAAPYLGLICSIDRHRAVGWGASLPLPLRAGAVLRGARVDDDALPIDRQLEGQAVRLRVRREVGGHGAPTSATRWIRSPGVATA